MSAPGPESVTLSERAALDTALDVLTARDPVVKRLVEEHGRPHLRAWRGTSRFAALVRSIAFQQLAGAAAAAIHGRLLDLCGGHITPESLNQVSFEQLRACGLSRAKATAITDLTHQVLAGQLRLSRIGRLSDDEVVAHLTQVWGIGRWTAEMFLLFTLGRPDVWPIDDYGVRAGFAHAWNLSSAPSPAELSELGEPYRPYRSVIAWYCWRAAESRPRPVGQRKRTDSTPP